MTPNKATIDLIKEFEGCRLRAYQDSVGVWTIGYGLTTGALPGVTVERGMSISQAQAEAYLTETLRRFSTHMLPMLKCQPTPNQYGAMLSLAYNIGLGAFGKSTCLKRFNVGDMEGAAEALTWFNKAGGKVLRGLVRRREAERDLFLSDVSDTAPERIAQRPDAEKTATGSTTMIAAAGTALSGAGGVATAIGSLDGTAQIVVIVLAFVGLAGIAWIMRERLNKLGQGV